MFILFVSAASVSQQSLQKPLQNSTKRLVEIQSLPQRFEVIRIQLVRIEEQLNKIAEELLRIEVKLFEIEIKLNDLAEKLRLPRTERYSRTLDRALLMMEKLNKNRLLFAKECESIEAIIHNIPSEEPSYFPDKPPSSHPSSSPSSSAGSQDLMNFPQLPNGTVITMPETDPFTPFCQFVVKKSSTGLNNSCLLLSLYDQCLLFGGLVSGEDLSTLSVLERAAKLRSAFFKAVADNLDITYTVTDNHNIWGSSISRKVSDIFLSLTPKFICDFCIKMLEGKKHTAPCDLTIHARLLREAHDLSGILGGDSDFEHNTGLKERCKKFLNEAFDMLYRIEGNEKASEYISKAALKYMDEKDVQIDEGFIEIIEVIFGPVIRRPIRLFRPEGPGFMCNTRDYIITESGYNSANITDPDPDHAPMCLLWSGYTKGSVAVSGHFDSLVRPNDPLATASASASSSSSSSSSSAMPHPTTLVDEKLAQFLQEEQEEEERNRREEELNAKAIAAIFQADADALA